MHRIVGDATLFDVVSFLPREVCYLVAEVNMGSLEAQCLARDLGGLTGHYLLMHGRRMQRLRAAGKGVGTGFIASGHCLRRELNRGVEWLFSNDAVAMQRELDSLLQAAAGD